jgi:SET domain-containing protein
MLPPITNNTRQWYAEVAFMKAVKATSYPYDPNSRNVAVGNTRSRGRGMFALRKISKGEIIERAPVIVIPAKQWPPVETSILSDYAFDWGEHDEHAVIALGYVSIYNHSYRPNAQLVQLPKELMMEVVSIKDIDPDEEITINYNGDPSGKDPLWFTRKR